jgi:patatin-related protein
MARPAFAPEQEVRFAVVMYGGVSLAIYINGVVQELFRMVRATAPEYELAAQLFSGQAYFDSDDLSGTERVYRELGQRLRASGAVDDESADPSRAEIRTRFVVDILSGSSAGGINAIFLAKAIANQQDIAGLRDLWIKEADIGALVNDRQSYKDVSGLKPQAPPRSLLNSGRLYVRALETLRRMAATEQSVEDKFSPAYAEELDLAVTTTDLRGIQLPIQLQDQVVYEARHRNVIRFVYAGPHATGDPRNDFDEGKDELLAFAARCTSAFPFAFEPGVARDLPDGDGLSLGDWDQFFPDYATRGYDWPTYAFADGGYLDNKPFSYATEALRRRRADVPVQRKLLYIEPDPSGEPLAPGEPPKEDKSLDTVPDAIDTVVKAMTLPRAETIRDDIQAVVERNRTVRRIRELTLDLRETILEGDDPLDGIHYLPPGLDDKQVEGALSCPQLMYTPYIRLRVEMVVDDLATAYVRLAGGQVDSDEVEAARILIRRLVDREWGDKREQGSRRRAFLAEHDVRFRLRRIAFVQDRINVLLRDQRLERDAALVELKVELNNVFVDLRRLARAARRRPAKGSAAQTEEEGERGGQLAEIARKARMNTELLTAVLRAPTEDDLPVAQEFERSMRQLLEVASLHLSTGLRAADVDVFNALGGTPLLTDYYRRFESFDMVMLPLTYPGLEEVNPVDVVRIAPEDATGLISEGEESRRKLAGVSLGHFGGFMDRAWRRNDLMWGRLDGAERILEALLPAGELRNRLRDDAFAAIIREELVDQDAGPLTDLLAGALGADVDADRMVLDSLHDERTPVQDRMALLAALQALPDAKLLKEFRARYEVPRQLDPQASMSVAGRATDVGGKVLEVASKRRSVPTKPAFWLARLGRLLWGVAEVSLPGGKRIRLPLLLFRHWTFMAVLLGIILILAGALGVEAAQRVGWILLIAAVVARVATWIAGAAMTEPPAALADRAPPSSPVRRAPPGAPRRRLSWLALPAAVALLIAAAWVDDSPWSWVLAVAGAAVLVVGFLLAVPHRRRLWAAGAVAALVIFAFAALELGHIDEDADAAAAKLPGDSQSGVEGAVRDGWDALWPWDEGDGGDGGGDVDIVVDIDVPPGDTVVVPPGLSSAELDELRDAIAELREDERNEVPARLLSNILAGVPGAVGAFSAWLQTARGLTADVAGLALGVLGRVGVRASISPTLNVKGPAFSLGGVNLGFSPTFALGGIRLTVDGGGGQPGPGPRKARRRVERLYADQSFEVGESTLTETARQRLVFLRERIAREPGTVRRIAIHGYADLLGRPDDNDELSRERARAVKEVLLTGLRFPEGVVRVRPHGEARKIAVAEPDGWRAYDRRAEVVIVTVR